MGGTSRVSREAHARFCERLGVKFPGPTRRLWWRPTRSRNSRPELIADDGRGVLLPSRPIAPMCSYEAIERPVVRRMPTLARAGFAG